MTTKPQDQRDIEAREATALDAPYAYEITYADHDCELVYAAWLDKYVSGEEEADILWRKPLYARPAPEALVAAGVDLLEQAIAICDEEGNEWDSDNLIMEKNYAHACRDRIRAILAKAKDQS